MTTNRRFGAVAAILGVAAAVTSAPVWGDPERKPQAQPITSGSRVAQNSKADRQFADDLANSKFTGKAVITYHTSDGKSLFALQVKPKLDVAAPRPCDYLVLVDTSASQVAGPLAAAVQITGELVKQAGPNDRIAIRTANIPGAQSS